MSTVGKDGLTAWENVTHMMKNILIYLKDCGVRVFVTINVFDNEVIPVFPFIEGLGSIQEITNENCRRLIKTIHNKYKLYPRGMTNIGLAMTAAAAEVGFHPKIRCGDTDIHIFMTDGIPTEGPTTLADIALTLPKHMENFMVGFGTQHNEKLLMGLIEQSEKGGEYHFVNSFEKAGVIYGSILDSILYRFAENIVLTAENCELYDYKTNTWSSSIHIKSMALETSRTIHLRFPWDNDKPIKVKITYKTISGEKTYTYWKENGDYSNKVGVVGEDIPYPIDTSPNEEVYKFLLRQEVLELLFHVKNKSFPADELRKNITELGETIKKYMKDKNIDNDVFLNNLCDDLMISLQTLEMEASLASKFTSARLMMQGSQRAYNAVPDGVFISSNKATTQALEKTPQFRSHTVSARSCSGYAIPRQIIAPTSMHSSHMYAKK